MAREVLQQVQVHKLRSRMEVEGELNLYVPMERFYEMALETGAATNQESAAELCQALHKAGVLLRQDDVVYLRAEEIADLVQCVLPGGRADTEVRLAQVEAELATLEGVHMTVQKSGQRVADAVLMTGLCVLITQFFSFIYLTWWELSWDVMEPIAYIISLFYSLLAYVYFLFTRHTFDLHPIRDYWAKRFQDKRSVALQFDAERFAFLKRLQIRYKRHLVHMARITP